MRVGFHVPVSAGLLSAARRAHAIGCECLQIFVRNARGWRARELPEEEVSGFRELLDSYRIGPLFVHACYLVNLASPDPALRGRSLRVVADDMRRAAMLGSHFLVLHPGHHMGSGLEAGLRTLAASLRFLLANGSPDVELLLENTAGRGTELGDDWGQFAHLLDRVGGGARLGLCFDTCHAHAAGHRLDSARQVGRTIRSFQTSLGPGRLRLIHLNDCRAPAGSRRDLHEHIGRGTIGEDGFRALLRRRDLRHLCSILETPVERPWDDRRNLRRVRQLMGTAGR